MYYIPTYTIGGTLCHHGIEGQHWGVQNGPPYPLDKSRARQQAKAKKYQMRSEKLQLKKAKIDNRVEVLKRKEGTEKKIDRLQKKSDRLGVSIHKTNAKAEKLVAKYLKKYGSESIADLEDYKIRQSKAKVEKALAKLDKTKIKSQKISDREKKKKRINDNPENFDPFEAMNKIDRSLSKKEQDLLGVGNDTNSTDDLQFFFNKDKTAYLITADYHGKFKDEHPISGKIIGIAAEKETRGTGATDKLINDAKKHFSNDRLVAEIDQDNIASRKLFERNGFKKVKEDNGIDYYIWENKKN